MQTKQSSINRVALALNQHRLALALEFSVVAIAVVALYAQDLTLVFTGALTSESTYHILAIPFLFGYLLYRKRKMVSAALSSTETGSRGIPKYLSALAGILLCAVAVLAYWFGSYTFTPLEYHMLTLPFFTAGLILILFNTQTLRQLLFPIAFLFFLTPPPDEILYGWGSSLANLSASVSKSLGNFLGMHLTLSSTNAGPVITLLRPGQVALPFNVDVACSGIYSIIGFVIFAVFIAYITRGSLWQKLSLLIMGIPLILALNIVRITAILEIGYIWGENLALTLFHDVGATVLMFFGVLILLTVTEVAFKTPKQTPPCPTCSPTSPKPVEPFCPSCGKLLNPPKIRLKRENLAKTVGVILAVVVLLSIQAPVFALTQSPPQVMVQTPSGPQINSMASMIPNISGYTQNYVYRDTSFEQLSGDDAALVYAYSQPNSTAATTWVAIQIAASVTSEHRWETCLLNFPLAQGNLVTVNQLDLRDIKLQDNPPMTARYFAFQYKDTNQTQVVIYWYETAIFTTNSTAQTKSVMISLITYPTSADNITVAENQLLPIAQTVNAYWQPIQTWTVVALALSQNGLDLSAAAATALVALIVYAFYLSRQEKKHLKVLYGKLPDQNKSIIKAVDDAKKRGNPTIEGIATELNKFTNTQIDLPWLKEKLQETETAGLIRKAIVNLKDEPALEWRNRTPTK